MRSLLSLLVFFVFLDCTYAQPLDMIYVEGGSFTMGCTPEQKPCNNDEHVHDVSLSSFYMSKYEITQGQWNTTMDSLPFLLQDGSNFPMYAMSWLDAIVFCNKLSQIEQRTPAYYADSDHTIPFGWDGQKWVFINPGNFMGSVYYKPNTSGYRLPTEAEWEYAARGGLNIQKYRYAGSDDVSQIMSMGTLSSVGTFLPNELGIYDLSGNLGEWCMDTYTIDHQGLCNPGLSSSYPQNANVVVRGGHYNLTGLGEFRNSNRMNLSIGVRSNNIGIRVVRSGDIKDYQWLACPTMTSPTPNATNVNVLPLIQWTSVPDATSYAISIGTSPNGSEVINDQNIGLDTFYQITTALPYNDTIYIRISAQNNTTTSQGCTEYSFVTTSPPTPEMILVHGGTIRLGGQQPETPVTIDTFYMGKYEVTEKQWRDVMTGNTNGISATQNQLSQCEEYNCAIKFVRWYDILVFCNRLSIQLGRNPVYSILGSTNPDAWGAAPTSSNAIWDAVISNWTANGYRMPTEAEWEYAARGASNNPNYTWAGTNLADALINYAWYGVNNNPFGVKVVGQKLPNAIDLYDVSGNVSEWCWDWNSSTFPLGQNNPKGPESGSFRRYRGGGWSSTEDLCRVSDRNGAQAFNRFSDVGLRLAASNVSTTNILACPTMTAPTPNSTNINVLPRIQWTSIPDATSYTISIGTSPNGSEVINNQNVGQDTFYQITTALPYSDTIYVRITAQNNTISSQGCSEYSFVTISQPSSIPEMVLVPGGTIRLGGQPPQTNVTIDTFYIGKYEVTQKQWREVMTGNNKGISANPSYFTACGDNCPVEQVSWYDILVFCNRLSLQENKTLVYSINGSTDPSTWGTVPTSSSSTTWDAVTTNWSANGYRIPTEAEWEYAARGATNTPDYEYAGSNDVNEVAWYENNSQVTYQPNFQGRGTHPVGTKKANVLGMYDMSGNVWEFCWDRWSVIFPSSENNPKGPLSGSGRMFRSGSWKRIATETQVSIRTYYFPWDRLNFFGFRLAASQ